MEGLVLVLWTSLLLAEETSCLKAPAQNLSCFQCFKVSNPRRCLPTPCAATDHVCVSHQVLILAGQRMMVSLSKRCARRCPNTNHVFQWSPGPEIQGRISRHCCSGYLCNQAPPTGQGRPLLLAGLSLLLLALLADSGLLPPAAWPALTLSPLRSACRG
ncbi:lymphocyte antigen 6L [Ochotona princeps]|uniref:lymphocyte antigen 6L n=1 Tax=Ochotona princeps TaxID=9978 RepID=UPI0027153FAC|nr:lymphocyte antigen 6L [Ochotona princeps]